MSRSSVSLPSLPSLLCFYGTASTKALGADTKSSDIIDTEHASGNINKMLLGSFVEEFDADEGIELNPHELGDPWRQLGELELSPEPIQEERDTVAPSPSPRQQNWYCGHCKSDPMDVRLQARCIACHQQRDAYATIPS